MKWLCGIFGPGTAQRSSSEPPHKEIRRWNFIKSFRKKDFSYEAATAVVATSLNCTNNYTESSMYVNPDEHAIAVAVATAAATEAAVVAAEAAAAVVRLTCRSSWCTCESLDIGNTGGLNTETAAVIIQSAYRGHLARRALRALKALIKVQAIVRGHIERKRAAEWLRRMQALMRAQLRAKTGRIRITPSSQSTHPHHARNGSNLSERTPDNHVYVARTKYSKAMMRSLSAPKAKVSHLETSH